MASLDIFSVWSRLKSHWIWHEILLPFLVIRLAQMVVVYLSQVFPVYAGTNPSPWDFHLTRFLYIWSNWDSGWYMSIIKEGYHLSGPLSQVQSNIVFYPLYPCLVKLLSWPIYAFLPKTSILIFFGLLISNGFFLGSMIFLYQLVIHIWGDANLAGRSLFYLLVFPASFYFFCFYSESTFLFFALASFFFAFKSRWLWTGVFAALVALSRPLAFLIVIPMAIIYLESIHWNLLKIRPGFLYLGLPIVAILLYIAALYPITGDWLAIIKNEAAWHRYVTNPLDTLLFPPWKEYSQGFYQVDQLCLLLFFVVGMIAVFKLPTFSLGVFSLVMVIPIFFTGYVGSATRYCSVLFPVYLVLARIGRHELIHRVIIVIFFTVQIIFLAAWSRYYWVQ